MKLELKGSDWVLAHPKAAAILAKWPGFEASVQPIKGCEQGRQVLVDTGADPPEIVALDADTGEDTLVVMKTVASGSGGIGTTPGGRE